MLLSANGAQDMFISGNPTQSHFISLHKQHTPFYRTTYPIESETPTDFGSTLSFRIPTDVGEFINRITLKGELRQVGLSNPDYKSFITNKLIDYVELFIGEQSIQKLTGEYIAIHHQSHARDISTYERLYAHGSNEVGQTFQVTSTAEDNPFFLDIPFYFHNVNQLAIPCCALKKHGIRVVIKLKKPNDNTIVSKIFETALNITYVHVGYEEKTFIESSPISHVIQQLQFSEFKIKQGILSKILMLNFNNPVSELFFVAHRASNSCDFIDIENIELNFNNTSVFNRDNKFLCYKQSLDNHIRSPSGKDLDGGGKYCSYSFSLNPISGLPMGSVNMSRIIHKLLKIAIPTNINEDVIVRVYAVSHNILMFSHGLAGLKF
jgi:hypothetical protein